MEPDDSKENGPEDETPEEMVNRRLAEAMDDQERYMDLFQTSSNMLRILSRFIADPVIIQDLEVLSNDGAKSSSSSSPASSASTSSTPSSSSLVNKSSGNEWTDPVLPYRTAEPHSNILTLQNVHPNNRRPLPWKTMKRDGQSERGRRRARAIGTRSEGFEDGHRNTENNPEVPEQHRSNHNGDLPITDHCGGGDDCQAHNRHMDDFTRSPNYLFEQHSQSEQQSVSHNQFSTSSCQTQDIESKADANTENDQSNTNGTDDQLRPSRNCVSIGISAQANINSTMAEISKAVATIRHAREMLTSFNKSMQTNNNNGECSKNESDSTRQTRRDILNDTAFNDSEPGSSGIERAKANENIEDSRTTQPILVKPAAAGDRVSNENQKDKLSGCNHKNHISQHHETQTENVNTSITPQATRNNRTDTVSAAGGSNGCHSSQDHSRSPVEQWSNFLVSRIGGGLCSARPDWEHHMTCLANSRLNSSRNTTSHTQRNPLGWWESQRPRHLPVSSARNIVHQPEENLVGSESEIKVIEEANVLRSGTIQPPTKTHETVRSKLTITLDTFRNALKIAIDNLGKEELSSKMNGNSDSLPNSKAESNIFTIPLNLRTNHHIPSYANRQPDGMTMNPSLEEISDVRVASGNVVRAIDIEQDLNSSKDPGEESTCGCSSNISLSPGITLVQPFTESDENQDNVEESSIKQVESLYQLRFQNKSSGEIIVLNGLSGPHSMKGSGDLPKRSISEISAPENCHYSPQGTFSQICGPKPEQRVTSVEGDGDKPDPTESLLVDERDIKPQKERTGFLRRIGSTIVGWFRKK